MTTASIGSCCGRNWMPRATACAKPVTSGDREGKGLMEAHPNSRLFSSLKSCSKGAGLVLILFGGLCLVGWTFKIDPLKNVFHGLQFMVPNTAMAFVLAGFSLWL